MARWKLVLSIEGEPRAEIVGQPLNGVLADLVGYNVAHEEWPSWIDELAQQIESDADA